MSAAEEVCSAWRFWHWSKSTAASVIKSGQAWFWTGQTTIMLVSSSRGIVRAEVIEKPASTIESGQKCRCEHLVAVVMFSRHVTAASRNNFPRSHSFESPMPRADKTSSRQQPSFLSEFPSPSSLVLAITHGWLLSKTDLSPRVAAHYGREKWREKLKMVVRWPVADTL